MAVQTSYSERHPAATAGLISAQVPNTRVSRVLESTSVGFGLAVSQGTNDHGCVIGGTLAGFLGATAKDITLVPTTTSNQDLYKQGEDVNILSGGQVYVVPETNVAPNDLVYFDETTGKFGNTKGVVAAGTPSGAGNTGTGTITMADPALAQTAQIGTYTVQLVQTGTDLGLFQVDRPDGTVDGYAKVGVAYDGQIKFTIADGGTDFALGDKFTVAVSSADSKQGPIPGARFIDTAVASTGFARINFGIHQG